MLSTSKIYLVLSKSAGEVRNCSILNSLTNLTATRKQCPFHVNLYAHGPIAKCWNRAETAPIAPFLGVTSLAAQHAVTQTTTNRVSWEGLRIGFARLHHACMRAALHTLHFFFLSWSAMVTTAPYLKCISINLHVGMFATKFGVDQMSGC